MEKSDLKTGMRVTLENGEKLIVIKNYDGVKNILLLNDTIVYNLEYYDDGFNREDKLGIIEIYDSRLNLNANIKGHLIWERKEEKTILTLDGVEYSESTIRSIIKKATN